MSDFGSEMGAANLAQVRSNEVTMPPSRRLTCFDVSQQALCPPVCSVRIEGLGRSGAQSSQPLGMVKRTEPCSGSSRRRRGTPLLYQLTLKCQTFACTPDAPLGSSNRNAFPGRTPGAGSHGAITETDTADLSLVLCASLSLLRRRDRSVRCRASSGPGIYRNCLSRGGLYGDCLIRGGSVLEQRLALHQPGDAE